MSLSLPSFSSSPSSSSTPTISDWRECRFLTASVLPVRVACNLACPFCFSKSSVSALSRERADWRAMDVAGYYRFVKERGAARLVITGGGEPLLRADDVVYLVQLGRQYFDEIALFTNGTFLTRALAGRLIDAGLSYVCYSRHHEDDRICQSLMGDGTPRLADFLEAARGLIIRATCVMARGYVDSTEAVWRYILALGRLGVRQFTFKHTYVAYESSVFRASEEDHWARDHQVEFDPFEGRGTDAVHGGPFPDATTVIARLPWGPKIRRVRDGEAIGINATIENAANEEYQVCYYHEPTPAWERNHRLCRSSNLLSDGSVYASLEDQSSLLYRLAGC